MVVDADGDESASLCIAKMVSIVGGCERRLLDVGRRENRLCDRVALCACACAALCSCGDERLRFLGPRPICLSLSCILSTAASVSLSSCCELMRRMSDMEPDALDSSGSCSSSSEYDIRVAVAVDATEVLDWKLWNTGGNTLDTDGRSGALLPGVGGRVRDRLAGRTTAGMARTAEGSCGGVRAPGGGSLACDGFSVSGCGRPRPRPSMALGVPRGDLFFFLVRVCRKESLPRLSRFLPRGSTPL